MMQLKLGIRGGNATYYEKLSNGQGVYTEDNHQIFLVLAKN